MLKLGEIQVATAAGVGEEEKLKSLSEIERDQIELNAERVRRLERVRVELRPPEASKSSVYKWFESVKESTQRVKDVNAAYVTRLRVNYEEANQNIIGQIESLLVRLPRLNLTSNWAFIYSNYLDKRINWLSRVLLTRASRSECSSSSFCRSGVKSSDKLKSTFSQSM